MSEHAWLPRASCTDACLRAGAAPAGRRPMVATRVALRAGLALLLLPALPLLAVPLPGRSHLQRGYCRLMLRALGVRITISGGPIRNLRGVLVVAGHVSWVDIFTIGAVLPGSFVAKAEMVRWPALGVVARLMKVIPIERTSLRRLPAVVATVATRLRAGQTVVAFPEGTTWCGLGYGRFRPAMFQAAIDAERPVQPLRLAYHHRDGSASTVPAYIGEDTLWASLCRLVVARRTVVHVRVESLQLPGTDRRELAGRCETAVRAAGVAPVPAGHALAA
ncbi:1-acyl-sn-glycerol-3-phosphate acyltransferase [Mycolicibacterium chitae]|uniref:1-acyl-sn-glycerol-3-phosphate acyltransferase n=1 Tax=Mycolicibacterium chitae TaxID=1792 RepID=A0A448I8S9_MYCCI|nr:lysophospholipid acyltransferase family protein [Mycolicibacterium chitae]MCV7108788.1 1-acyl-sn-glycerol-3-phosphate acyltransferase [Mycolicibacterium chitae]BBZ05191.1 1-acyl-sn-glycerol-3-phosphate acyltransferase [Mycolicibacterium chitae]VEG48810.1 1-acyl-sn-glycerol-3-phosphate acyltransferase [Mycolicibacterium chitae]